MLAVAVKWTMSPWRAVARPVGSVTPAAESGQGLIEFSIILAVLIGIFVGTFEIMNLYRQRTDLETVTRMAARQAAEIYLNPGVDVQAEIENYVIREMDLLGYDTGRLTADPAWRVDVTTFQYDGGALVRDAVGERCRYGDYIAVELNRSWSAAVLPLDAFFDSPSTGLLKTD